MNKDTQEDSNSAQDASANDFIFSRPNIVESPERISNTDNNSGNLFGSNSIQSFAFAAPALVERENYSDDRITSTENIESKPKKLLQLEKILKLKLIQAKRLNVLKDTKKIKTLKSPLNIKKTSSFLELEQNTRKKKDVKLELSNSITCTDVPDTLLNKIEAQGYFEKFGEVLKLTIKPRRKIITVYFSNINEADNAFNTARSYKGEKFKVAYTTSDMLHKPKKVETIKGRITSILNIDDDVKEELEAMRGLEYNLPDTNSLKTLNTIAKAKVKKAKELIANREAPKKTMKPLIRTMKPIDVEKKVVPPVEKSKVGFNSVIVPKVSLAMIDELQNQIKQPAVTSEEKYKVLDARDRLMRLKQNKQQNLATAKVKKGTCSDMCPEKERYMRESQRTLSSYEQLDSYDYKINHLIAVKQYSRSSADQEEPMPHDLRPVKSLKMTMSYLLYEICDLCEKEDTNLAEWYHFLWDRMRSIRKDITHQELCCVETVELVEQCARFHIVASERLCAEEISVFDPKINSENLTKCLQTLKYMYYDLREHGINCKNEPEFQAYIILLNLNNGSFISDLRTLPCAVQQSLEVKFALNIYSAMAMDNYCRFFKLVKSTTYLNACILLRYFNQVREKAFSIIIKAHCRASGTTEYPLYELVDILGFEGPEELSYFCSKVGLKSDTLNIKLSKEKFHTPKSQIEQRRAKNLIWIKMNNQSIGQCIAGGILPTKIYANHKPHSSFDSRGYLLSMSYDAKDQNSSDPYQFEDNENVQFVSKPETKNIFKFNNIEKTKQIHLPLKPLQQKSDSSNQTFTKTTTEASIFKNSNSNVFTSPANNASSIFGKQPSSVFSSIPTKPTTLPTNSSFNTTVNKSIFSGNNHQTNLFKVPAVPANIQPEKNINFSNCQPVKRSIESSEEMVQKKSCPNNQDLLNKQLEEEEKRKAEEKRIAQEKLMIEQKIKNEQMRVELLKKIDESSKIEFINLETEIIYEECTSIVKSELNFINMVKSLSDKIYNNMLEDVLKNILDEELFIQDMLIEVDRRLKDHLVIKYYRIWKQWASRRRIQRREALDNTPVWLQPESLESCAKKLYSPHQTIAINFARESRKKSLMLDKKDKLKQTAVEFIVAVGLKENIKYFESEPCFDTFWKLGISWPLLDNHLTLWRHKNLVNKYLNADTVETVLIQHKLSPQERLNICIRQFEGLLSENCLIGADGLLFVVSANEEMRFIERRLTKSILCREKLMPIPVVILVFGDEAVSPNNVEPSPIIENLLESGHVSEYSILYEKSTDEETVIKVVQTAILWLAINRSPMVPLEMNYLKNVFNDCLTEEIWLRILSTLSTKPNFSTALCDANFVIDLHNQAVNHIMDIIQDVESMSYTDFAPELKVFLGSKRSYPCTYEYFDNIWKSQENRAELEQIMSSFIFPPWRDTWPLLDMFKLHSALLSYCRQILSNEDSIKVTDDIMADIFLLVDPNEKICLSFTDVVIQIMRRKIELIPEDTRVVYNKNHIKHFQTLPWWFKSPVLINYAANHDHQEFESIESDISKRKQLNEDFGSISEDELNETYEQLVTDVPVEEICQEISTQAFMVDSITEELDKQMEEYKKWSQSFEAKLQATIEEGNFNT